jgi:hypothetical protein
MSKAQCCRITAKGLPCKGRAVWHAIPYKYEGMKHSIETYCGIHVGARKKYKSLDEAQLELLRRSL